MKTLTRNLFFVFLLSLFAQIGWGQSVVISQYIETNSGTTPKGIEIFNVSGTDITFSALNNLEVYKGTNGASCASDGVNITSGTLAADEVWVIGTTDLTTYAITNGTALSGTTVKAFTFNGDDALEIYLGGVLEDMFGVCGSDPGSSWSGGGVDTKNNNLQIKNGICSGDVDGWTDPSIRFDQIANGSTMTGFGDAPASCSGGPEVDWCNLQWPSTGNIRSGDTFDLYARVFETGVTEAAGQGANITAWIGYNTSDSNPSGGGWTWIPATYSSDQGNNDEYTAEIGSTLPAGTYYYASRFQLSGGPYKYGGYNAGGGGFWDGTTNVSGTLTVDVVDWCNIQSPEDGTVMLGSGFNVYAQIYEDTETNGAGQAANITSWIGYSTVDNDPTDGANAADWTWVHASYNTDSGNNDEYSLDLENAIGAGGTYYYVSRFQISSGPYAYGGFNTGGGGFWDNTYTSGSGNKSGRLIIHVPTIIVNPTSLTGFTYEEGNGPSAEQSFTVEGTYLSDNITVTPPANWEISETSGGPYQTSAITLTQSGGTVSTTTIYTRMVSGLLNANSPFSGNITCASAGDGISENVAVDGTVTLPPALLISEVADPGDNANARFVEIYNNGANTVDLSAENWNLTRQANGTTLNDIALTGTIASGSTYVVATNSSNFNSAYGFAPDQVSGYISGNGDDGYYLYSGGDHTTGTLVDAYGVINEDGTGKPWEYTDGRAVRYCGVSPNATWTTSEWTITSADVADMDPGVHCAACSEPTVDASSLTFPTRNSTSLDLSWTNGDGDNRIVVCRKGAAVSFTPTDSTTYTANSDYSAGAEVGTGGELNKVVYNGNGNSVSVTGLEPGTTYYFEIFEYSCSAGAEDYLTSGTPAEGNETTLPENVTNFTLTCITNTTATLTWTLPAGGFDRILIAVRESTNAPSDPNCDGIWLISPSTDFSTASTYCGNSTDSRYVYNATGTNVTITGLTPGADYVFKAFTYNESDWSNGTQTAEVAEVKNVTGEQTVPSNQQVNVSWINPTTCYDEILVVGKEGGSVTAVSTGFTPDIAGDGSAYIENALFGTGGSGANLPTDEYCLYKGTETDFDADGLTNLTQYCFKIFVRNGTEWSSGVEICDIPADVTVFNPGELIIIGFDSNVPGSKDSIFLTNLVDIKPGTEFLYVNSRFEAGAPANVRTNEWHGGGDNPNADPGVFKISYSSAASGNIPAGSIISFGTSGTTADNIQVNGTPNSDFSSTNISSSANIHATAGDQIWLLQGTFTDQGNYHTLDGNVLWGLTNNIDWVPIDQPVSNASDGTGRESRLNPDLECFNLSMPTGKGYALYLNSSDHNNTKRNLLMAIMNGSNWTDGLGDATMNFNADFTSPYQADSIGKPFTITASASTEGTWIGGSSGYGNDWFACMNWEGLTVPDNTVDVTIPNVTDAPIIDHISAKAPKYNYIAECNNITIDNETLTIQGSSLDTLFVNGDLTLQNSGTLDMNSGGTNDGLFYLSGNWNNQATFDAGKGTVVFNGTNAQTISTSSAAETFNNLRLTNNNLAGVTIQKNIIINDTLSQTNNLLNLNGHNIQIGGVYENTDSYFEGDAVSNFIISSDVDNGNIDSIYFKNNMNVYDFTIDRTGKSAVLMTNLSVNNDMTITAGNVTLTAGHDYDVGGILTNTPGTPDVLILKSDASGTASLIQATGTVPATVERYLTGDNWHFIFAPLSQIDTAVFTVTSWNAVNPNFYWYNEPIADFWQGHTIYNPAGWTSVNGDYLETDRGYINYFTADKIYTQTGGNLNDADKSFTLSYTDNGTGTELNTGTDWDNFEGWNLFGNPYVSAVDWDNAGLDKTYIENFIYYWDDASSQYKYYGSGTPWTNGGVSVNGGSQYIPAGQGFFVKALSTGHGQTFSIPKAARVHNAQTFWKKDSKIENNLIRLSIIKGNNSDETVIRTLPPESGVTEQHDAEFDAYKMFTLEEAFPQLYSLNTENTYNYAVNSLPEITDNKEISLGVYVGESGQYSIKMSENLFSNMHIWLEDRYLAVNTNLLKISTYSFTQSAETNTDRFFLHLGINNAPKLNVNIPNQTTDVNILYEYTIPENIFVDNDFADELTISAELENGNALPGWLNFNAETGVFSGTPSEVQSLNIKVTASDMFGESVSDIYKLTVNSGSSINDISEKSIHIYPNPTKDVINIQFLGNISQGEIILKDITGKIIHSEKIFSKNNKLYMSNLSKGVYILEIRIANQRINKKIIKD